MRSLLVVGDTLLDQDLRGHVERLAADAPVPVVDGMTMEPRPGGAGLAACIAAGAGHRVRLLTALCDDDGGRLLRRLLEECGVEVVDLGLSGHTPEKWRVQAGEQTLLRLDRGGRARELSGEPLEDLSRVAVGSAAVVVSDYGYGVAASREVRDALEALEGRLPILWDPHPSGPAPIHGVRLATPNRREAAIAGASFSAIATRARDLRRQWQADGVAVTLGAEGALLVGDDAAPALMVPAPQVTAGDPCGAGDSLAVAAGALLGAGASVEEAVEFAVGQASAFVAAGGAPAGWRSPADSGKVDPAAPEEVGGLEGALRTAGRTRSAGGRLVVAGGCFDLLHAGHVQLLESARRLGDALIVLINGDRSLAHLKGPERPFTPLADRIRVLEALRCVDAVAVFDGPTPVDALQLLRPQVFAKGGDYRGRHLPEQDVMAAWGGEVVLLPLLPGRSSSRLIEEVMQREQG